MLNLLTEKLKQYSSEYNMKLEDNLILLSFSGGIDSTVMASLLIGMREKYKFRLGLVHINHHAHTMSKTAEKFCKIFSHNNDVLFHLHNLFVNSGNNFEACAREKRYTILNEIAEKYSYDFILTAHHQDDQLETVYMKKIDGGDWISQIGIRERMGKLRRPFLGISRKNINIYARQNNIKWIEDPTNTNMSFRRNKVRHLELPQAFLTNPKLKKSILNNVKINIKKLEKISIKLKRDQNNVINNYSNNNVKINRKALKKYNLEELKLFISTTIPFLLKITLEHQSGGLWREFKNFINQSITGSIFNIGTLTFIINRDEIIAIDHYQNLSKPKKMRLCHNLLWYSGQFKTMNGNVMELSSSKNQFTVPNSLYQDGLYIRSWQHGDRIISATSQKHISLSDLYINYKLSKYDKLTQPVVVDGKDMIFWIPGMLHGNTNYNLNDKVQVINWVQK